MRPIPGASVRTRWVLGATVLALLALVAVVVLVNGHSASTSAGLPAVEGSTPTVTTTTSPSGARSLTSGQQSELEQSIRRMRDVVPVNAATSPQYPAVRAEARQQPDLYAAAFVRQLLTQDYRTSREHLLAWVQSESAQSTDPLVVGLTPVDLRSSMAVASVQDGINGSAPVPSQGDWANLAQRQGYSTVQIQRVTEPVPWAAAVASGQITDPGVTARQVDADVTLNTIDHGKVISEHFSVALVINLEGTPVLGRYGFVAAITYNLAAVG